MQSAEEKNNYNPFRTGNEDFLTSFKHIEGIKFKFEEFINDNFRNIMNCRKLKVNEFKVNNEHDILTSF